MSDVDTTGPLAGAELYLDEVGSVDPQHVLNQLTLAEGAVRTLAAYLPEGSMRVDAVNVREPGDPAGSRVSVVVKGYVNPDRDDFEEREVVVPVYLNRDRGLSPYE